MKAGKGLCEMLQKGQITKGQGERQVVDEPEG